MVPAFLPTLPSLFPFNFEDLARDCPSWPCLVVLSVVVGPTAQPLDIWFLPVQTCCGFGTRASSGFCVVRSYIRRCIRLFVLHFYLRCLVGCILLDNSGGPLLPFPEECLFGHCLCAYDTCLILYWVRMYSFVTIFVVGVGSTTVVIVLEILT